MLFSIQAIKLSDKSVVYYLFLLSDYTENENENSLPLFNLSYAQIISAQTGLVR